MFAFESAVQFYEQGLVCRVVGSFYHTKEIEFAPCYIDIMR